MNSNAYTNTLSIYYVSVYYDYVIMIKNFLNPEGHQNCITGSKVTAILVKG